jgi:hypothetical protein
MELHDLNPALPLFRPAVCNKSERERVTAACDTVMSAPSGASSCTAMPVSPRASQLATAFSPSQSTCGVTSKRLIDGPAQPTQLERKNARRIGVRVIRTLFSAPKYLVKRRVNFDVNKGYYMRRLIQTTRRASSASVKVWRADQRHGALQSWRFRALRRILLNAEDLGIVSGQFERSGDFRWNRALRDSTVFLTLPESCVWGLPAFAAAEAEIVATHLGERTNFSRARVSATYIM